MENASSGAARRGGGGHVRGGSSPSPSPSPPSPVRSAAATAQQQQPSPHVVALSPSPPLTPNAAVASTATTTTPTTSSSGGGAAATGRGVLGSPSSRGSSPGSAGLRPSADFHSIESAPSPSPTSQQPRQSLSPPIAPISCSGGGGGVGGNVAVGPPSFAASLPAGTSTNPRHISSSSTYNNNTNNTNNAGGGGGGGSASTTTPPMAAAKPPLMPPSPLEGRSPPAVAPAGAFHPPPAPPNSLLPQPPDVTGVPIVRLLAAGITPNAAAAAANTSGTSPQGGAAGVSTVVDALAGSGSSLSQSPSPSASMMATPSMALPFTAAGGGGVSGGGTISPNPNRPHNLAFALGPRAEGDGFGGSDGLVSSGTTPNSSIASSASGGGSPCGEAPPTMCGGTGELSGEAGAHHDGISNSVVARDDTTAATTTGAVATFLDESGAAIAVLPPSAVVLETDRADTPVERCIVDMAVLEDRKLFVTVQCAALAAKMTTARIVESLLPALLTAFECDDYSESFDDCTPCIARLLPDVIACMEDRSVASMTYFMGLLMSLCCSAESAVVIDVTTALQRIIDLLDDSVVQQLILPFVLSMRVSFWSTPRAVAAGQLGVLAARPAVVEASEASAGEWFNWFIESSRDQCVFVREAAVRALPQWVKVAQMYHFSYAQMPQPLVSEFIMDDLSDTVRYLLVEQLVPIATMIGKEAASLHLRLVHASACADPSWRVRYTAATCLGQLAKNLTNADDIIVVARQLSEDEEPQIKAAMASQLTDLAEAVSVEAREKYCVPMALNLATDRNAVVRSSAVQHLASFFIAERESVLHAVSDVAVQLMRDPEYTVQVSAIRSFGDIFASLKRTLKRAEEHERRHMSHSPLMGSTTTPPPSSGGSTNSSFSLRGSSSALMHSGASAAAATATTATGGGAPQTATAATSTTNSLTPSPVPPVQPLSGGSGNSTPAQGSASSFHSPQPPHSPPPLYMDPARAHHGRHGSSRHHHHSQQHGSSGGLHSSSGNSARAQQQQQQQQSPHSHTQQQHHHRSHHRRRTSPSSLSVSGQPQRGVDGSPNSSGTTATHGLSLAVIRQRVEGVVAALEAQLKAISDAGNWRLRDAVVYALRYFSHVLREDQFAPLTKMTRRLLCDPVSKVRERAVETLAEVAVCYGAEWAACTVVDMLHAEFDPASQATYMRRVMAIECLAVLLPTVAGLGQQDLRRQHLLGTTTELLQQYAADSVPNVRIALAKAMPRWKNWFASTSREIAVYNEVVHRLKEDGDVDVAEAAKTITLIDSRDREPPHDGTHSSSLSTPF